jgi:hypothetical protein
VLLLAAVARELSRELSDKRVSARAMIAVAQSMTEEKERGSDLSWPDNFSPRKYGGEISNI